MAEQWFYSAAGTKRGPVASKELVALARSGKLRPTDLVWKEGMAEWKPAEKVKGLFPPIPAAAAPPLPKPVPAATTLDLASTTKGLLAAAATAVQRAVTKATETAKQAQEALPAGEPSAPLPGRKKTGLLVVGGVLVVGAIFVIAAAGIALLGRGRGQPTDSVPKKRGEFTELRAFADVPPPVQEAADAGHEVWELTGWHRQDSHSLELDASLYVVREQGTLTRLFVKQHHKKGSVLVGDKGKEREVIQWAEQPLDNLPTEGSKLEYHWSLHAEAPNRSILTERLSLEIATQDMTTTTTFTVAIDDKVGEGLWQGERSSHTKFRGRLAKLADEQTSEKIEGGTVRLLGRRSPTRADPAATVADAEKRARAEAADLLPQVGELRYHFVRSQNLLADMRKSSGPICDALRDLNRATDEGIRLDPKLGLYNFGTWYSQSADEYDLGPTRVGHALDATTKDPVAAFIDIRTKLHTALRAVVEARGGGIIDGDAEQTATAKLNAGSQRLLAQTQELLKLLDATKTAELERHWAAARRQYAVLMAATREMRERAERLRPTVPKDLGEQLQYIGGITHLVQGELYYLEDKAIRIPVKYVSVFTTTRIDANKVAIMAHFRFKGNTTGKNAFGAAIPVALYECDERHAEILLRQRDFEKQAGPFFALFRAVHNEPLENIQQSIRNLVGNEQYQAVINAAEKRAAQDAVRVPDAAAKSGGERAGAVEPPVPPVPPAPKDAAPPAPGRPPMPEPKAAVPAKPRLIPVYRIVFPGDVLLTTNEEEVKNIAKVYPGDFKGTKGHYKEVFGHAYAEPQEGTVLLRRYLNSTTTRHEFVTFKIDLNIHKFYKEEGMGAWVYEREQAGTTLRCGFFRLKDAAYEYGPKKATEFFRKLGYVPTDLKFYLLAKPEMP